MTRVLKISFGLSYAVMAPLLPSCSNPSLIQSKNFERYKRRGNFDLVQFGGYLSWKSHFT
jgi:hypothetical protein